MSEQLKFFKGQFKDLPKTQENLILGALYHCLDTQDTYLCIKNGNNEKELQLFSTANSGNGSGVSSFDIVEDPNDSENLIIYGSGGIVGEATIEGGEIFNDYENNVATGIYSHAEGNGTIASRYASHAEGEDTIASGYVSHAEGCLTTAHAFSHAEGCGTQANGHSSHSEGYYTTAIGDHSHAEGKGTIAHHCQHVEGQYNIEDTGHWDKHNKFCQGIFAHIVGNGTSEQNRSNAHTLDWEGNAWFAGAVNNVKTYTWSNPTADNIQKTFSKMENSDTAGSIIMIIVGRGLRGAFCYVGASQNNIASANFKNIYDNSDNGFGCTATETDIIITFPPESTGFVYYFNNNWLNN